MSSSASSTAGTPEEQPVNDSALTAIDPEQNAPENATDQVESEAPTRVYLHPEQLAMIQTPEALPIAVRLPPPSSSESLAARSSRRECR